MAPGEKASFRILVLDEKKVTLFCATIISNHSHEAALQETIGLGQRLLKNEVQAIRVEIKEEHKPLAKPVVILTRDDLPTNTQQTTHISWLGRVSQHLCHNVWVRKQRGN